MSCLFCDIAKGEIPCHKIYEDTNFLAFLDIHPVNLGHTLIIPKAHAKDLFDLPSETLTLIGPIIQKVAQAVKLGTGADGLNLGMNNGAKAGQIIEHAHLHLIPRFAGDGLKSWPSKDTYQPADFEQTKTRILNSLN